MSSLCGRCAEVIRTESSCLRRMLPPYAGAHTVPGLGSATVKADHRGVLMSNRTYRVTEIVGTSPDGIDQAIRNGVERACETLRHVDWFEVTQVRGQAKDGGVEHFQVGLKIGFRLEDDGPVV